MTPVLRRGELRSLLRGLLRSWRLSLAAVLCVAIGTAAVSATATLVHGALLRPLPFPESDRLVRIWRAAPDGGSRIDLSYPLVRELDRSLETLDTLEATARARILFFGRDGGRRVEGEAVTPGYLDLLGIRPRLGRLFDPEEYGPEHQGVMLLSHAAWGTEFAFDSDVVGRTVTTDRGIFEVVGVLPEGFRGTVEEDAGDLEFWVPIRHYLRPERQERWNIGGIWALGRRAPGTSLVEVREELVAVSRRLARRQPETMAGRRLRVEPMAENWRSGLRKGSWVLSAAAGGLLLIAALNVAALMLARSLREHRSRALRLALGAPRRTLVVRVLTETALLVSAGGVLGWSLGQWLLPWLMERATVALPDYVSLKPDAGVLVAVLGVLALSAAVAALAPTLTGTRVAPASALEGMGRSHGSRPTRRTWLVLVALEVALTTVLVFGSVTLVRSWGALHGEDLGFRTEGIVRLGFFAGPEDASEPEELLALQRRIREAVGSHPGVEDVTLVWPTVPIWGAVEETVRWPSMPEGMRERGLRVGAFLAEGNTFELLEVERRAGRLFRPGEDDPVAVVSESLAERIGGIEAAVGTELEGPEGPVTVVGVVEDVQFSGAGESGADLYELYMPLALSPQPLTTVLARTSGSAEALAPVLRRRLGEVAPRSAVDWVGSFEYFLGERYREARFAPLLVGLVTIGALCIAGIGIFALLATGVEGRRREIGVRRALGASGLAVVQSVVARGLRPVAGGVVVGGGLAWIVARWLEAFLYRVGARDAVSFALTGIAVLVLALVAAWLPARRAARVDPMIALRKD